MPEGDTNQTAQPLVVTAPRPPSFEVRRLRPPVLVALLLGALLGGLYGHFAGDLRETPFGGLNGALFGLLAGLVFVLVGLLLYGAIRNVLSGTIVLGLFAMLAMALVGGLFGAVIGLIAGAILGALVGAVKARGGLVVASLPLPVRGAPTPPLVATEDAIGRPETPSRGRREHAAAGDSRTAA